MKTSAAKDIGDAKGDKSRKRNLRDVVEKAVRLSEEVDLNKFPEIGEAILAVRELQSTIKALDEVSAQLKLAPQGSQEAVAAQKQLDHVRRNVDVMLGPVGSTMEVLEHLLQAAEEMMGQLAEAEDRMRNITDLLTKERARLASAGQALRNSVSIG
jgi:chromosome segregation ATPase